MRRPAQRRLATDAINRLSLFITYNFMVSSLFLPYAARLQAPSLCVDLIE